MKIVLATFGSRGDFRLDDRSFSLFEKLIELKGMVYGIHIIKKGSLEPDGELAFQIVEEAIRKGLMLFAPVGFGGATIKICPPLVFDKDAVKDGIQALRESIKDAI